MSTIAPAPALYIPHGGGPLPLLGDPGHASLVGFLQAMGINLEKPQAIIVVSAHWEERIATVSSSAQPSLLFDYHGFPPASYEYRYPAPGSPEVAAKVQALLRLAGIECAEDPERGLDHGAFVPLMLMYPEAQVPCLQLSLLQTMDARQHMAIGQAIGALRNEGVMILGSGSPFHNMNALIDGEGGRQACREFTQWLIETCCDCSPGETLSRLVDWQAAPRARYAHPREEHLLPLQVCAGAALGPGSVAQCIFDADVMGYRMPAFLWTAANR